MDAFARMISGMAGICYIECTDNLDRKGKLCSWIFWNPISVFAVTGICEKRNFKSRFYKFSFQMSELFHNKHFISVRIISQVWTLQKQMKNITLNDGPSDTIVKNEIHIPYVWNCEQWILSAKLYFFEINVVKLNPADWFDWCKERSEIILDCPMTCGPFIFKTGTG